MFPNPAAGALSAAAESYGAVKQKQDERLHEQEQPTQAQREEKEAQGKVDDPKQKSEGMKEIEKATKSALARA